MEACFKIEELWALIEESRKKGLNDGVPTPEQYEKLEAVLCPSCKQKSFKFFGQMDEPFFFCTNCNFQAGFIALTTKDRAEMISEFFESLKKTYEKAKKQIDSVINAFAQYRP